MPRFMRRMHAIFAAAVVAGTLGLIAPAHADEYGEVSRLIKATQYQEALLRADAWLASRPRDAQMRFMKGVILTEINRPQDAIAIFSRLTEEFPQLPEPWNNLAVLYAGQGQFDRARTALDRAMRTNPAYATAYENLGDIHARLASQAYAKALQIDAGAPGAQSKLALVKSLGPTAALPGAGMLADSRPAAAANPSGRSSPHAASTPAPPAATTPTPATTQSTPAAVPKLAARAPAAAPTPAAPVAPAPPLAPSQATAQRPMDGKVAPVSPTQPAPVAPAPAPQKAAPQPVPAPDVAKPARPARQEQAEREAVLAAVNDWARVWSARDVKAYLNHYAPDFDTPGNQSRKAWAEERQARIAGKGRINVKIESPQVTVEGARATVKFRQVYTSDRLTANSRKTLVLVKQRGAWLIQKESTGT